MRTSMSSPWVTIEWRNNLEDVADRRAALRRLGRIAAAEILTRFVDENSTSFHPFADSEHDHKQQLQDAVASLARIGPIISLDIGTDMDSLGRGDDERDARQAGQHCSSA